MLSKHRASRHRSIAFKLISASANTRINGRKETTKEKSERKGRRFSWPRDLSTVGNSPSFPTFAGYAKERATSGDLKYPCASPLLPSPSPRPANPFLPTLRTCRTTAGLSASSIPERDFFLLPRPSFPEHPERLIHASVR